MTTKRTYTKWTEQKLFWGTYTKEAKTFHPKNTQEKREYQEPSSKNQEVDEDKKILRGKVPRISEDKLNRDNLTLK